MQRLQMIGAQEISLSKQSLTLAPLGLTAEPVIEVTPPDISRSPLPLRTDSDDVSKTPTVAVDPLNSLIGGRNAPGDASLALELHSNQLASSSPKVAPWASPRRLRGPTLPPCACSEGPTSISPSCPIQNCPNGQQDASPDLEAAVWTGDVCYDAATTVPMDDSANVRRWKEEIDMLLVFAGLFSGVVTGFLTESTKSLRPESNTDTVAVLEHISAQLRSPQTIGTPGDLAPEMGVFAPSRETVQINCLWFVSLILSLGVAFVSILVKWWLQGHHRSCCIRVVRTPGVTPKKSIRRRPHGAWRVQAIMTALPVLLLVALVLFCAGLSILLITLDVTVGAVAMGVIGFVFVFSAATTVFLSQK